jgi:hypothetical protein
VGAAVAATQHEEGRVGLAARLRKKPQKYSIASVLNDRGDVGLAPPATAIPFPRPTPRRPPLCSAGKQPPPVSCPPLLCGVPCVIQCLASDPSARTDGVSSALVPALALAPLAPALVLAAVDLLHAVLVPHMLLRLTRLRSILAMDGSSRLLLPE